MICKNCNYENADGAKFCRYCGKPMISAPEAPAEQGPVTRYADQPVRQQPARPVAPPVQQPQPPVRKQVSPVQQPQPPVRKQVSPVQRPIPQNPPQDIYSDSNPGYRDGFNTPVQRGNVPDIPKNPHGAPSRGYGGYDGYEPEPPKKSGNTPLLIALIVVVSLAVIAGVIVALLATGIISFGGSDSESGNTETTVAAETAEETIAEIVTEEPTTDGRVTVPDITGMKSSDAYAHLNTAQLSHEAKFEYSDSVPEDYIIKQSPAAGEKAMPGSKVTLTISRGSKPKTRSSSASSSSSTGSGTDSDRYGLRASSRYLSRSDISWMTKDEIQFAINEIYAKHGLRFTEDPYKSYFESKSWYHPDTSDMYVVAGRMNIYEEENLKVMGTYRNSL